eukprot:Skav227145  [mRNA]  locus=scaffold133:573927:577159:- [translate_table: standard]
MGLPDPVAFAMLTALGAIPDPMAMLNEMMAAAAPEDEEKTAFWKSGPAQEADSAELERLAKQVKEAAEQGDSGTGRERSNQDLTLPTTLDKIALSRLPSVTEAQVRLECARHGALTAVVLDGASANGSGITAYVCYASSDMAQLAVRRMSGAKIASFGNEPVQVKLISELPESVRSLAVPTAPALTEAQPINPQQLPEYLRSAHSRSAGRKRASRSTRRKKRKSRRQLETVGQSTIGWWERRRDSDDSDSGGRTKRAQKAEAELIAKRPRQVAIKGVWAQFVYSGYSYYFNIGTEQTVWETPDEFEEEKSKHQSNAII